MLILNVSHQSKGTKKYDENCIANKAGITG